MDVGVRDPQQDALWRWWSAAGADRDAGSGQGGPVAPDRYYHPRTSTAALLERLIAQNPASFNFHVPLSDGGVLLGASPELLLRKEARISAPAAGRLRPSPAGRCAGSRSGQQAAGSGKDRHEHELVTQAMKTVRRRAAANCRCRIPAADHHADAVASGDAD
jgi:hypothetical protein